MPITKSEFVNAFKVKAKQTLTIGKCTLRRTDYPASVEMRIGYGDKTVVLEWIGGAVEVSSRGDDSSAPIHALLVETKSAELKALFEKIFGAPKMASISSPQGSVSMGGLATVMVTHDSSSIVTPSGFAAALQIASAILVDTPTGKAIASELSSIGARVNVEFSPGKFSFNPIMASDTKVATDKPGVLLADTRVGTRYYSLKRSGDTAVVAGWFHGALAALLGHELVHALHAYQDNDGYVARAGAKPAHPDWEDLEEQYTITGVLDGKHLDHSECDILRELGLRMRWGHVQTPALKTGLTGEQAALIYGQLWQKRFS